MTNEPLLAFVDETGDRGFSRKSSLYFAMSAVIFPASFQQKVKNCIAKIKSENEKISGFGIRVLSKDNNPESFDWWPEGWN